MAYKILEGFSLAWARQVLFKVVMMEGDRSIGTTIAVTNMVNHMQYLSSLAVPWWETINTEPTEQTSYCTSSLWGMQWYQRSAYRNSNVVPGYTIWDPRMRTVSFLSANHKFTKFYW